MAGRAKSRSNRRTSITSTYPLVEPSCRAEWRAWLEENHATCSGAWLVYRKKGPKGEARSLTYDDAVEEALCFGWIDSVINRLDAARYKQLLTPRKPGSGWSALNKRRVQKLTKAKLLHPSGKAKIVAAKKDGSWTALDHIEALVVPPDFKKALSKKSGASKNFEAFTPGVKKLYLYRINSAKRPETRAKRIAALVALAAENIRRLD